MKRRIILHGLRVLGFALLALLLGLRIRGLRQAELPFSVAALFQGESGEAYVQLSCYWSVGKAEADMEKTREQLEEELETAYGTVPPLRMAWGSLSAGVAERGTHSCAVEICRVSEEFFALHPWPQTAGSYRELEESAAVLNERAAWELFASRNCVGLTFLMDGATYTVRGVCETPGTGGQVYVAGPEEEITFCELLLPEKFPGFAENLVSKAAGLRGGTLYNNTERPALGALFREARAAFREEEGPSAAVQFPAWERNLQRTVLHLQLASALLLVMLLHLAAALLRLALLLRPGRAKRTVSDH